MFEKPPWMLNPPETLTAKIALLQKKKHLLNTKGSSGRFLRRLLNDVNKDYSSVIEKAKEIDPLSFFKPSFDQALILNSWIWGIAFNCVYTANRIGKTTACIIDKILWIVPNEPRWIKQGVLKPYVIGDPLQDPEGKSNPRQAERVHVLSRPDISYLPLIHSYINKRNLKPNPMEQYYSAHNWPIYQELKQQFPEAFKPGGAYPYAPMNKNGEIWMGAPDQSHHENIIMPLWKQYLPKKMVERESFSNREFTFKITGEKKTTTWEWLGKSYESKDTKWSGKAVEIICLTEGVLPHIMKEVKVRFTDPGVGSHDFTPYEPANVGGAEALAKSIKSGREKMPLPTFVFEGFSVHNAPTHVLPKNKRLGLIEAFQNTPEGKARLEGKFYTNSGLVLNNLRRDVHLLEGSIEELKARFPNGRIYRGFDPGYDHPSSCAWALITPANQWIIYRIWAERGLDICSRCKTIIELSGNTQSKKSFGPKNDQFYMEECNSPFRTDSEIVNATIADYHVFKEDEVTGQPYSLNYTTNGLSIIESIHLGPEDRALKLDSMLAVSPYYPNLNLPKSEWHKPTVPPGPQVYFLREGPGVMEFILKMEEFYWERQRGGENKGMAKDKVPSHGDDELDAVCYVTCSPFRWTSWRPPVKIDPKAMSREPERHLAQGKVDSLTNRNPGSLQSLQVGFFGGEPENSLTDEEDEALYQRQYSHATRNPNSSQ